MPYLINVLYKEGQGMPHQSPTLLLRRRQEGRVEVKESQPDSKRASILSEVGDAVGKTYNLVQLLSHVLKRNSYKSDSNLRFSVFDAEHLNLFSSYYTRCRKVLQFL